MKRKTRLLLDRSQNSLVLSIELFNRPFDCGRVEGVLLCLDHAFEMVLKALVLEKTGRIRNPRETFNYGFDKCLNICQSQLSMIDEDQALILRNLNGFRDAATHDIVERSGGYAARVLCFGVGESAGGRQSSWPKRMESQRRRTQPNSSTRSIVLPKQ